MRNSILERVHAAFPAEWTTWARAALAVAWVLGVAAMLAGAGRVVGSAVAANAAMLPESASGTGGVGLDLSDGDASRIDVAGPSIQVSKSPDRQSVRPGGTATFNVAVTNNGQVTLTDVTVTDALAPACDRSIGTFTPGSSYTYVCTLSNVTEGFTNVVEAGGTPPTGPRVTATDSAAVTVGVCDCPADRFESDNDSSDAVPLPMDGSATTHTLNTSDDQDYFVITGLVPGRSYNVSTFDLSGEADTYMTLRNSAGSAIAFDDDIDASRCLTDLQFCASSISWIAEVSGPYYVQIYSTGYPNQEYPSCPCPSYSLRGVGLTVYLPLIVVRTEPPPPTPTPTPSLTPTPTSSPTPTSTPTPRPGEEPVQIYGPIYPNGIAVDAGRHYVYVTSRDDDRVHLLNGQSRQGITSTQVGNQPWGVAFDPGTNKVFVANFASETLSVVDATTLAPIDTFYVGPNPTFVKIANGKALVAIYGNNSLVVVNTSTHAIEHIVPVPGKGTWGLAVNPYLNRVYVSTRETGTIVSFDGNGNFGLIGSQTIETGPSSRCVPYGMELNPENQRLYVACAPFHNVNAALVYQATANGLTPIAQVPIGNGGEDGGGGVTVNVITGAAYFTNSQDNTVTVLNSSNANIATIGVGANPFGIGVDPLNGRLFVANRGSNSVSVVSDPSLP